MFNAKIGLRYFNKTAEDEDNDSDIDEPEPTDSEITELEQLDAITSSTVVEEIEFSTMTANEIMVIMMFVVCFLLNKLREGCCKDCCALQFKNKPLKVKEMKTVHKRTIQSVEQQIKSMKVLMKR